MENELKKEPIKPAISPEIIESMYLLMQRIIILLEKMENSLRNINNKT